MGYSHPASHLPGSSSIHPSLQGCSQGFLLRVCGHAWGCPDPGAAPAPGLVEPHDIMGPLLEFVQVPLDGSHPYVVSAAPTQLCVICKSAEGPLYPTVCVINKNGKEHWPQDTVLRDTTCHQPPSGHWDIDHNSLHSLSQFVMHQVVHPSCLPNLDMRMLCGTVSKASQKFR